MSKELRNFGQLTLSEAINESIKNTISDFYESHGVSCPNVLIEVESIGVSGYEQRTFRRDHYLTIKIEGI